MAKAECSLWDHDSENLHESFGNGNIRFAPEIILNTTVINVYRMCQKSDEWAKLKNQTFRMMFDIDSKPGTIPFIIYT